MAYFGEVLHQIATLEGMESMKTERLMRRGAVYYFRAKVPLDLRDIVGKTEITESLRTTDHKQATRLARERSVELDQEFERLRGNGAIRELTPEQSRALAEEWVADYLKVDEDYLVETLGNDYPPEVLAQEAEDLRYMENELRRCLNAGDTIHVKPMVEGVLKEHGLNLDRSSPAFKRLMFEFMQAGVRAIEKVQARARGEIVDVPAVAPVRIEASAAVSTKRSGRGTGLADLQAYWTEQATPKPKTMIEAESVVRRFIKENGDLALSEITRDHVIRFRDSLRKAGLAPGTIKKLISLLSAMFSVAYQDGRLGVTANPADKVVVRGEEGLGKARKAFSIDELNRIFAAPVHASEERPLGGGGEAAFWIPLLGLFTGARLSEIAQLLPSDVKKEDGVTFVHFTDEGDGDKKLKTGKKGRKRVPVHPEIVRIGFLGYVEQMRRSESPRLFPAIRPDRNGNVAGNWSKWWGRYLDDVVGIDDPSKDFHSFRHTFKHFCRAAGIAEDQHDALTGHHNMTVARLYGSAEGYPLKALAKAIGKLKYDGLRLSSRAG